MPILLLVSNYNKQLEIAKKFQSIYLQKNLDKNNNIQKKYDILIKDYEILDNQKKYCDEMIPKIEEINLINKKLITETNRLV